MPMYICMAVGRTMLVDSFNFTVGNATVTQIPVNSNIDITTPGHKLQVQGMTKDMLVVDEWDCRCRCANWVYTVLSRVRTRKGLFLTKPLDLNREFNVP